MSKETWSFIIVAGGTGSRLGGTPKQFRLLAGIPVWKWSAMVAEKLWEEGAVEELIIVVPEDRIAETGEGCRLRIPTRLTAGGAKRSESVMNGLKISCGSHVLVHDAARPFITPELCRRLMEDALAHGASVPLVPCTDSLKRISSGKMICVDRTEYFRTQTPQVFEKAPLIKAITLYGTDGTDEAEAWSASGREISRTEGLESNFKITTQSDWERALSMTGASKIQRTGHGYDIHRLVKGRKLILAGIEIEDPELGLLGHSDADIVMHTVMDAMLGAAGLPDIGTLFPASDAKWKDADSRELLRTVVAKVRSRGWRIDWVDGTLAAQSPRLGPRVPAFLRRGASYISAANGETNFNMKVKSGEGCGAVGRNECMICHGVAVLSRYNWDQA